MKKIIAITMMMFLAMSFVIAVEPELISAPVDNEICSFLKTDLGIKLDAEVPDYFPYKNDVLNIYTMDDSPVSALVVQNKVLKVLVCEEIDNATIKIFVKDLETVKAITTAESPADAFDAALSEKTIILEGQNFGAKVGTFFIRIGAKIASWFS
jgi:hypothetical protein